MNAWPAHYYVADTINTCHAARQPCHDVQEDSGWGWDPNVSEDDEGAGGGRGLWSTEEQEPEGAAAGL